MANAIQAIYRDLEYATTLTRQRSAVSSTPFTPSGTDEKTVTEDDLEDIEETWTFVDDVTDPDFSKKGRGMDHENSGGQSQDRSQTRPADTSLA